MIQKKISNLKKYFSHHNYYIAEIIPDLFYLLNPTNDIKIANNYEKLKEDFIFYHPNEHLHYQGFTYDFGPYNLGFLSKYFMHLNKDLERAKKENKIFVQFSCVFEEDKLNSAFICGAYSILYLNYEPEKIFEILTNYRKINYIDFCDASHFRNIYTLDLLNCLKAIKKAKDVNLLDLKTFDIAEYFHYEKVKHGDLNWIIPNKILAFSGPYFKTDYIDYYPRFGPDFYFDYFKKNNVSTIVRLNEEEYDKNEFLDFGFDHVDLIFKDGSSPSLSIVNKFLKVCENAKGAIAVHCKAGLGRTGTLIACYLIKHFKFTAYEAIAWTRICRPGSVIANQQTFLIQNQNYFLFQEVISDNSSKIVNCNNSLSKTRRRKSSCKSVSRINILNKNKINDEIKKFTCELKQINLDNKNVSSSSTKKEETQGDILNKIKYTRSSANSLNKKESLKNLDLAIKELSCEEIISNDKPILNDSKFIMSEIIETELKPGKYSKADKTLSCDSKKNIKKKSLKSKSRRVIFSFAKKTKKITKKSIYNLRSYSK